MPRRKRAATVPVRQTRARARQASIQEDNSNVTQDPVGVQRVDNLAPGNAGDSNNGNNANARSDNGSNANARSDNGTALQNQLDSIRVALHTIEGRISNSSPVVAAPKITKASHLKTSDVKIPRYAGSHESKTPYDFLQELEKYRLALGYTDEEILHHVVPLALTDEAYRWYIFQGNKVNNWQSFKEALRKEFQQADYLDALRRELDDRSQGCQEPLTSYIRVINDFYDRLDPNTPEKERIGRIFKQMHPEYRVRLQTSGKAFNSLLELMEEAYKAQADIKIDRTYREPRTFSNIEPSLAYKLPMEAKEPQKAGPSRKPLYMLESAGTRSYSGHPLQTSSFDRFSHYHPRFGNKGSYSNRTWVREDSKSGGSSNQGKNHGSNSRNFHKESIQVASNDNKQGEVKSPFGNGKRNEISRHNGNNVQNRNGSSVIGPCFVCDKTGHLKRNCPMWAKRKRLDQGN